MAPLLYPSLTNVLSDVRPTSFVTLTQKPLGINNSQGSLTLFVSRSVWHEWTEREKLPESFLREGYSFFLRTLLSPHAG